MASYNTFDPAYDNGIYKVLLSDNNLKHDSKAWFKNNMISVKRYKAWILKQKF